MTKWFSYVSSTLNLKYSNIGMPFSVSNSALFFIIKLRKFDLKEFFINFHAFVDDVISWEIFFDLFFIDIVFFFF
jgi:hypothetical protein